MRRLCRQGRRLRKKNLCSRRLHRARRDASVARRAADGAATSHETHEGKSKARYKKSLLARKDPFSTDGKKTLERERVREVKKRPSESVSRSTPSPFFFFGSRTNQTRPAPPSLSLAPRSFFSAISHAEGKRNDHFISPRECRPQWDPPGLGPAAY